MAWALPSSTEAVGYGYDHWLFEDESASGCPYAPYEGAGRGASNRTGEQSSLHRRCRVYLQVSGWGGIRWGVMGP